MASARAFAVARRHEVTRSTVINHCRKAPNGRRNHRFSKTVRDRNDTTLRGFDVRQHHHTGSTEQLGAFLVGNVLVVNDEALGMHHHSTVVIEVLGPCRQ